MTKTEPVVFVSCCKRLVPISHTRDVSEDPETPVFYHRSGKCPTGRNLAA